MRAKPLEIRDPARHTERSVRRGAERAPFRLRVVGRASYTPAHERRRPGLARARASS
ncbi:hypothetical protein DB32_001300 [Sandaracinus amylolyticus]|uniref:Uncharacterized protein n=1 Tax=Sandaracinus amylolyticus TaxID=927083 RepID=A0A0F6YGX1_9BACT|nr:hypothetical protein DB32_001300 [Sandaracinus amylolyticus]